MIVSETAEPCEHIITGIAGKKGMSVINIEKDKMNSEVGFGRNVLRALEKSNVSFEHMPSGVDTMSVVIQTDKLAGKETTILDEIDQECILTSYTLKALSSYCSCRSWNEECKRYSGNLIYSFSRCKSKY